MRTNPILAVSMLAALALAAPASAATISPTHVRFPQVAVNAHGRTVVAWERLHNHRYAAEVRIGAAPLRLGPAHRLARQGFSPKVAIGTDGTAAVQWMEQDSNFNRRSIRVAVARPGHGFGAAQVLDQRTSNMAAVGVAVQPGGRVVAIWQRGRGQLEYALATRDHRFGTARALTATGTLSPGTIALDPRDGTVVLAYGTALSASPPTNEQAGVRTLAASATAFSAPTVLSASGPGTGPLNETHPFAITGPAGAGVAYTVLGLPALNIARRAGDGSWATTQRIAIPAYGVDIFARDLAATLPADGAAAGAWSIVSESPDPFAQPLGSQTAASIALPSAPLGAPQELSPGGASFGPAVLAAAGDETFLATPEKHGRVLLATRGAGADRFQGPIALTSEGDGDVVLAAGGSHVLAAYQQDDRLRLKVIR